MTRVGILTDSTAGIPYYLVNDLHIEIVPYHVIRDGQDLRDGVDVKALPFADELASLKTDAKLPTTSFPSPGEYVQGFMNLAEHTREIVALTMTSRGSGAYQSCSTAAELVREEIPDIQIQVIDTRQVAMAQGWAAIESARAASKDATFAQVAQRAQTVSDRSFIIQTADTLRFLQMGGRIGRAQYLTGTLLDFKPLIGMVNGEISYLGIAHSRARAYAQMVDLVRDRIRGSRRVHLAFTHCGAEPQTEILRDLYFRKLNCIEEMTAPLSSALAVHSGPGTVGVCLYAE